MAILESEKKLVAYLLKLASDMASDAGMSGSMTDGGAGVLRDQVSCFVAGRDGVLPACWERHIAKYRKINDPEYAEYLRLKEKFERYNMGYG